LHRSLMAKLAPHFGAGLFSWRLFDRLLAVATAGITH